MILELYAGVKLTPKNNFAVDSISDYLATISSANHETFTDLNYYKNRLNCTLTLPLGQSALNIAGKHWNYCKITNTSETSCYYYIIDLKWRSQKCIELVLLMDTFSTFGTLPMTDKTLIHRQHKNRYKNIDGTYCQPIIDKTLEGISPIMHKSNETILQDGKDETKLNRDDMPWYLIYANDNSIDPQDFNQVNPVSAYFIPKYSIMARLPKADKWIQLFGDPASFEDYDPVIALSPCPPQWDKNPEKLPVYNFNVLLNVIPNVTCHIYVDYLAGDFIRVYWLRFHVLEDTGLGYNVRVDYVRSTLNNKFEHMYDNVLNTWTQGFTYHVDVVKFDLMPQYFQFYAFYGDNNSNESFDISKYETFRQGSGVVESDSTNIISSMRYITLTDSRLIKVIELPYCPLPNYIVNDVITFTTKYVKLKTNPVDGISFALQLDEQYNEFKCFINDTLTYSIGFDVAKNKVAYSSLTLNMTKTKDLEPKLNHSELSSFKLVYDSFSKQIRAEYLDGEKFAKLGTNYVTFTFYPSENISSKFMFDFSKRYPQKDREDYDNIIIVSRNNEKPIYSSQYINYLRNGYNYDIKARERKEAVTAIQTGLTAVGAITGGALGVASGNPAVAISAVVGGVTSVTSSVVNGINQSITLSMDMEAKQAQLKAQAVSVATSDDLSLLDYYTYNNKIKAVKYVPSEVMQNNLFNLFYYMGYKCEYMEKPKLDTRIRFNFIMADIELDVNAVTFPTTNISRELLDDYISRFSVGLTLFHKYSGTYDFEQKLENWETAIEPYI